MADSYSTLSKDDLLALARDALRGKESDLFRMRLLPEDSGGRAPILADQVERLKETVAQLEDEVAKATPLPEESVLHGYTVEQLDELLEDRGLSKEGVKDEKIARLVGSQG